MRKRGAKERSIDVIATWYSVIVQLLTSWTEQLHWIVSPVRDCIAEANWKNSLLIAQGAWAWPKLMRLIFDFHVTQALGSQNVTRMNKTIQDSSCFEDFVDPLRWISKLSLCRGITQDHRHGLSIERSDNLFQAIQVETILHEGRINLTEKLMVPQHAEP